MPPSASPTACPGCPGCSAANRSPAHTAASAVSGAGVASPIGNSSGRAAAIRRAAITVMTTGCASASQRHPSPDDAARFAAEMSPLCRRFARRWHVEPPHTADEPWRIADADGQHIRKRFFTEKSANEYCQGLR